MSQQALVEHCLELLAPPGRARSRRMFGGHGLYVDELFIALVAFDRLYLKVDEASRPRFAAAGCEPFVYEGQGKAVTLGYYTVPAEAMDSAAEMAPWARLAMQAALAAKAKARPKAAVKRPPKRKPAAPAAR